jgi:hypothetical protein
MKVDPPRILSDPERDIVTAMLVVGGNASGPVANLGRMRVVEICDCGCASFEMEPDGASEPSTGYGHQLADAYGTTPDGKAVGLILWGFDERVTYLELYSLAAKPPFALPAPDTLADVPPWPQPTD